MALFNLSSLDKVPHMDPVPAYVWERHFPARNVRRTFSPLVKGERQSYVRCLLKQGNVSTAQTLPTSRALWILQRCGHLQHQNAHFGDCSHRTSKQAFTSARTTLPISSTLVASSNSSPRSESIFLSLSSTCTSLQGHTQILERSRPSHLLLATSTTSTLGQNHCTYTTQHNSIGEVSPDFTDSWHSFSVLLGWWPNRLSAVCLVAGMAPTKNDMGWSLWQYWMEGSASVGKFMEEGDRKCQRRARGKRGDGDIGWWQ